MLCVFYHNKKNSLSERRLYLLSKSQFNVLSYVNIA